MVPPDDANLTTNRVLTASRVAALYDIHGNLPALEAVLQDVRDANVDLVVVGGDIFPGPMPRESIDALLRLEQRTVFIQGNGDREVAARMNGVTTDSVPEEFQEVIRWSAEQLPRDYEHLIAEWPRTVHVDMLSLGPVLFCHATPRSDVEIFTSRTPASQMHNMFDGVDEGIVVCGHTHMQFDRRVGRHRVVNAGSVGMPFGRPGAYWLLLGPHVTLRHTVYDLSAAARRIEETRYPRAREFATRNVLHPPSESATLEAFSRSTGAG